MKYRELKQILNRSLVNPSAKDIPPHIKLIIEANNPNYWLQRAIEALRELQVIPHGKKDYEDTLSLATLLLTLCRYNNEVGDETTKRRTQTGNKSTKRSNKVSEST